jgi:replicative DNA helicase Mcm
MKKLGDLWNAFKGLDEDTQYSLNHVATYISKDDAKTLEYLLKYRKAYFEDERFPASSRVVPEEHYPVLRYKDSEHATFVESINETVRQAVWREQLDKFSKSANSFLVSHLAPNILGMDEVKNAVVLQLVMNDRFHVLLLGDPGTGKTDILRSACDFSPIHSFGLGSGASKAGLSVMAVGKQLQPGLLVQAHGGLCCIDELNLMKVDDRAALYNAMEKGFVNYDKGSFHERFPADIRLLATANPKGDQFRGTDIDTLKKQLPFDAALLSRFHLTFIIRKPNVKEFREISQKVLKHEAKPLSKEDIQFIHTYLGHCRRLEVKIPAALEEQLVSAATKYKAKESKLLFDITPRLVKGLASLAKASAAIELRTEATPADVHRAVQILERSLNH